MKGYVAFNRKCIPTQEEWRPTENAKSSTYTAVTEHPENIEESTTVAKADSKGTFKAIVIFLLVIAILLCIALGIVILWRYCV